MGLSEEQRRTRLVELFTKAGVHSLNDEDLGLKFIQGIEDPTIESLHIDSLAAMEICIGLESDLGWSISPEKLLRFGRLSDILRKLKFK